MDIHDACGFTLLVIGWGGDKRAIEADCKENDGHRPDGGQGLVGQAQKAGRVGELLHVLFYEDWII